LDCGAPKRWSEDDGVALTLVGVLPADVGFFGVLTGLSGLKVGLTPDLGVVVVLLDRLTGLVVLLDVETADLLGVVIRVAEDALARLPANAAQASDGTVRSRLAVIASMDKTSRKQTPLFFIRKIRGRLSATQAAGIAANPSFQSGGAACRFSSSSLLIVLIGRSSFKPSSVNGMNPKRR
jgi:hypothetical protein